MRRNEGVADGSEEGVVSVDEAEGVEGGEEGGGMNLSLEWGG